MNPLTITIIATSALVTAIVGPLVVLTLSRRQLRAAVFANSCERWIEALRDALAEYVALVTTTVLMQRDRKENVQGWFGAEDFKTTERIMLFKSRFLMLMNPIDQCDQELRERIDAVHAVVVSGEKLTLPEWCTA